ncbi:minor teichoic acid biosynthesis protein GgaB [Listeria marthii FSL S4-120]|uniref:Minor teichoic acid biosynthesis protein GgaB n=1 Tax=Listeria marthii FSL S4-120 TaxID=702457 RepID=A0ABP2JT22_9LIST|nr:minor teichoic acid biosynthesis protein GgaB [Listeria marthii FSL S4-120]
MIAIPVFFIMFFTATSPSFEQTIGSFYLYFNKEIYFKNSLFEIDFIFLGRYFHILP